MTLDAARKWWNDYGPLVKPVGYVLGVLLVFAGVPARITDVESTVGALRNDMLDVQSDVLEVRALQRVQLKRQCLAMTLDERVLYDMSAACNHVLTGVGYTPPDRTSAYRDD